MSDSTFWLAIAGAAVWLCVGCFAAFLGATQETLARRVRLLERADDDDE